MKILIDMGDDWGVMVPVNKLETINSVKTIKSDDVYSIRVCCGKKFVFESMGVPQNKVRGMLDDLLVLSTGIIPKHLSACIVRALETQFGKKFNKSDLPLKTLSKIKKYIYEYDNIPYLDFSMGFDAEKDSVVFDVDYNPAFTGILSDWLNTRELNAMPTAEEKTLLFVHETLGQIIGPHMPEPEQTTDIGGLDSIPVLGGTGATKSSDMNSADSSKMFISGGL